jgi:hypothetical protein
MTTLPQDGMRMESAAARAPSAERPFGGLLPRHAVVCELNTMQQRSPPNSLVRT